MRRAFAVSILVFTALSAHAQKNAKVYDHTGVVRFWISEPDVDVRIDGHTIQCFGDVCETDGGTSGVLAYLDKEPLFTFGDHKYLNVQDMMVSLDKDNPLMGMIKDRSAGHPSEDLPGATEWTFHYRLDTKKYWGAGGNTVKPVFCVPLEHDKNGKTTDKEACYALR